MKDSLFTEKRLIFLWKRPDVRPAGSILI